MTPAKFFLFTWQDAIKVNDLIGVCTRHDFSRMSYVGYSRVSGMAFG